MTDIAIGLTGFMFAYAFYAPLSTPRWGSAWGLFQTLSDPSREDMAGTATRG